MWAGDRKQGINKCWPYGGAPLAKKLESRIRTGDNLITCFDEIPTRIVHDIGDV